MATAIEKTAQVAFDFLTEVIQKVDPDGVAHYPDGFRLEAAREILKYTGFQYAE